MAINPTKTDWGPFSLSGKVAIVTGGAAGIGLGISKQFASAGAAVMAVGRRTDGGSHLALEVPGSTYYRADLADPAAPDLIVQEAVKQHGRVDILVNNAAMLGNRALLDITAEYIDAMAAVNVRAVLLLARAFAAARRAIGAGGKIVNVGSFEGFIATLPAGMAAYGATKTAVRGLTVSLARELGPWGIHVNAVAPGVVMHENLLTHEGAGSLSTEQLQCALAALTLRTNLGRLGTPEDIANVCVFLASAASDYLSGQTILADGGATRT